MTNDFLEPSTMILLYARGAFPMADEFGIINWYLPEIRTIIPLDKFNFPRSLKKFYYHSNFEYKFDSATLDVIKNCADRETTWISDELIEAYKNLIQMGNLHSVEVYQENQLVGGLYGVTYKGAFFGESMFSKVTQASKCALIKLIEHLREKNFVLLDVQYQTEHLKMFGAVEIPFDQFEKLLIEAYKVDTDF
ncbi:MAG: leucyl/phenylalanyl-tRNA--protein transferase [Ignavibacteriales bacterium]|jgi:leucyl/phenylalanyl-tRNA--protein transferase|nr:leucyl/phenylalanyl-tRNA--protein transferase [Ignavibacteriales bacterium]